MNLSTKWPAEVTGLLVKQRGDAVATFAGLSPVACRLSLVACCDVNYKTHHLTPFMTCYVI